MIIPRFAQIHYSYLGSLSITFWNPKGFLSMPFWNPHIGGGFLEPQRQIAFASCEDGPLLWNPRMHSLAKVVVLSCFAVVRIRARARIRARVVVLGFLHLTSRGFY